MECVTGWLLRLNLSNWKSKKERIPCKLHERFIGGKGLGTYYLFKEVPIGIDPLAAENKAFICTGPAQGLIPVAGRYCVVTKSPLTGLFLDSHGGGFLGPEIKHAGYDVIAIEGKSDSPVGVHIADDEISFYDANGLWGQDTHSVHKHVEEEFGQKVRTLTIGPAGENGALIACAVSDYHRTLSRGGVGTLLGSKRLKALSVRGTMKLPGDDQSAIKEIRSEFSQRASASRKQAIPLTRLGTASRILMANGWDMMPTSNYQRGEWEHAESISGETIMKRFTRKRVPCHFCPLGCSFLVEVDYSWAKGYIQCPEYESLALLGSNLGISDLETLFHLNHECNLLGLDTISTGNTMAWFLEVCERGRIPAEFSSEQVRFGDGAGLLKLIEKISSKLGVGAILAQGVRKAAEEFGNNTMDFAVHVKGLELAAWDPRGKLGLGMSYATSEVGGSHLRGWPVTSDIPDRSALPTMDSLMEQQDLKVMNDSLIMCYFSYNMSPPLTIADNARLFSALMGMETTPEMMRDLAQDIWLLARWFNEREYQIGKPRDHDVLPKRLMRDKLPSGVAAGRSAFIDDADFEACLDRIYEGRGIDKDGRISEVTKKRLRAFMN